MRVRASPGVILVRESDGQVVAVALPATKDDHTLRVGSLNDPTGASIATLTDTAGLAASVPLEDAG